MGLPAGVPEESCTSSRAAVPDAMAAAEMRRVACPQQTGGSVHSGSERVWPYLEATGTVPYAMGGAPSARVRIQPVNHPVPDRDSQPVRGPAAQLQHPPAPSRRPDRAG